jgi:hypothetical protein
MEKLENNRKLKKLGIQFEIMIKNVRRIREEDESESFDANLMNTRKKH